MSTAAERGDVNGIIELYTLFSENNVEPNADTFSFAFEALGKRVRWVNQSRQKPPSLGESETYIATADSFIQRMEDCNVKPTHHVIRDYVEFLCLMGQVETANSVVLGVAEEPSIVSSKTCYRLATANCRQQQFDVALEIAQLQKDSPMKSLLLRNISRDKTAAIGEKKLTSELSHSFGTRTENHITEHRTRI